MLSLKGQSQEKGLREDISQQQIRKVMRNSNLKYLNLEFGQIQELPKIIEPDNVMEMPRKANLQIEVPEISFSDEEEEKWVYSRLNLNLDTKTISKINLLKTQKASQSHRKSARSKEIHLPL